MILAIAKHSYDKNSRVLGILVKDKEAKRMIENGISVSLNKLDSLNVKQALKYHMERSELWFIEYFNQDKQRLIRFPTIINPTIMQNIVLAFSIEKDVKFFPMVEILENKYFDIFVEDSLVMEKIIEKDDHTKHRVVDKYPLEDLLKRYPLDV